MWHLVSVQERQLCSYGSHSQRDPYNHQRKMQSWHLRLLKLNVVMGLESFYKLQRI